MVHEFLEYENGEPPQEVFKLLNINEKPNYLQCTIGIIINYFMCIGGAAKNAIFLRAIMEHMERSFELNSLMETMEENMEHKMPSLSSLSEDERNDIEKEVSNLLSINEKPNYLQCLLYALMDAFGNVIIAAEMRMILEHMEDAYKLNSLIETLEIQNPVPSISSFSPYTRSFIEKEFSMFLSINEKPNYLQFIMLILMCHMAGMLDCEHALLMRGILEDMENSYNLNSSFEFYKNQKH